MTLCEYREHEQGPNCHNMKRLTCHVRNVLEDSFSAGIGFIVDGDAKSLSSLEL